MFKTEVLPTLSTLAIQDPDDIEPISLIGVPCDSPPMCVDCDPVVDDHHSDQHCRPHQSTWRTCDLVI